MNILILTGKFGMGHFQCSKAIEEQLKKNNICANVETVDIYEYSFPKFCKVIYKFFQFLVNRGAAIYNLHYKHSERMFTNQKPAMLKIFLEKLDMLLEQKKPDVIISTLHYTSQLVSIYKEKYGANIPLITCITDITSHLAWINENTDFYVAPSEEVKNWLVLSGVNINSIAVGGIPVGKSFTNRHKYHIGEKHLLIMGGGLGMLPKNRKFYESLNKLEGLKTTIITGKNKKMFRLLHNKYENIEVIGFTDKVSEYMQNADAILTKPGGITMFEAITSELPIITPIPTLQQEIDNSIFIKEHKIGTTLYEKKYSDELINIILDNSFLNECRTNIQHLKREYNRNALLNIINAVLQQGICA